MKNNIISLCKNFINNSLDGIMLNCTDIGATESSLTYYVILFFFIALKFKCCLYAYQPVNPIYSSEKCQTCKKIYRKIDRLKIKKIIGMKF